MLFNVLPGIFGQLFDAERHPLIGGVDFDHDRVNGLPLLDNFGRVGDFAGPRHIGDVDHAVDAFLDFNERAEVGEVAHFAGHLGAGRVFLRDGRPGIRFELPGPEGNLLFIALDFKHHGVNFIAHLEHVGCAGDPLGPGQFADVDHAFDAFFQLDKCSVGDDADDLAMDLAVDRVLEGDVVPGIPVLLLEAERHAFFLAVDFQNHDFDLVADLDHFAGVIDAAPAHVGDMQQAVQTVEVDERAEVGEILDRAGADFADLHFTDQRAAVFGAFEFDQFPARQNNVLPLLVDLDDLKFESFSEVIVEVARGDHVNLRCGQERLDADIDGQATLDLAADLAFDGAALIAERDDPVPVFLLLGFLVREDHHAVVVLDFLEEHFDLAPDHNAFGVEELVLGNQAFRLVADIHQDFILAHVDDGALHDATLDELLHCIREVLLHWVCHTAFDFSCLWAGLR